MGKSIFKSFAKDVLDRNTKLMDMAMGHMAIDIERLAKQRVPVSNTKASGNKRGGGGHLQSSITHFRSNNGQFRVIANKEYAAYQERGMAKDGSRVVKHYTTPGTGAHYFQDAIDKITANKHHYVAEAAKAVGL